MSKNNDELAESRVREIKNEYPEYGKVSIGNMIIEEFGLDEKEAFRIARRVLEKMSDEKKQPGAIPIKEEKPVGAGHVIPDFTIKPSKKIDVMKSLEALVERVNTHPKKSDYDRVVIKTDKPIAIMKASDLHFGGLDVSYESLLQHIKFLMETDNFYLQLFGDDLNLMVMHKTVGARHDIMTPSEQITWLESWVHAMFESGKLISMGWGNHSDEFTERTAGFGIVSLIEKYNVPYFRGLGYLDLVVQNSKGEEYTYPMAFTHAMKFHSFMNPTYGNKRMEQMHAQYFGVNRPIAREYITGHTHYPSYTLEGCLPEDRVYYIKCGTFKTNCAYSQRYFGQGRIGVPTVVYHPDRFEHVCFPTPYEAYRYMNGKDWNG